MSFSYWGADKITLQKPVLKPRQPGVAGSTRRVSPGGTSYSRESSANAKFGTRLLSSDHTSPTVRPASRRTQTVPMSGTRSRLNNTLDDGHSVKTMTPSIRAAKDANARSSSTNPPPKRPRQTSQTSTATTRPNVNAAAVTGSGGNGGNGNGNGKPQPSPVVSEDSELNLYRHLAAQDPTLNQ